jgi:hypothetical protein
MIVLAVSPELILTFEYCISVVVIGAIITTIVVVIFEVPVPTSRDVVYGGIEIVVALGSVLGGRTKTHGPLH